MGPGNSRQQKVTYSKVLGKYNPADLFTKYLDAGTMDHHVERMGFEHTEGRAREAPTLNDISKSLDDYINGGNTEDWECLALLRSKSEATRRTSRAIATVVEGRECDLLETSARHSRRHRDMTEQRLDDTTNENRRDIRQQRQRMLLQLSRHEWFGRGSGQSPRRERQEKIHLDGNQRGTLILIDSSRLESDFLTNCPPGALQT